MSSANGQQASGYALITGASGGIGLELAKCFAADGFPLILVARSAEKLEEIAADLKKRHQVKVVTLPTDLSEADGAQGLYDEVCSRDLPVDFLINNAGYGLHGPFLELSKSQDQRMLQLNIFALTELTRNFAKDMVERKKGRILNVASTAAFQPGPLMATYYASKAYVLSFSEALANELEGTGVTVTTLCPGFTQTGFADRAGLHGSRLANSVAQSPEEVARQGYLAMFRGKAVEITGAHNKVVAGLVRFTPRAAVRRISRYVTEKKL